mmetsp:Transcript_7067/g.17487  ORF Transcript_7067/g.17487 Transcript_7067/m.17487 type:complete len:638 (-) Transcript_7067:106-2019(-)
MPEHRAQAKTEDQDIPVVCTQGDASLARNTSASSPKHRSGCKGLTVHFVLPDDFDETRGASRRRRCSPPPPHQADDNTASNCAPVPGSFCKNTFLEFLAEDRSPSPPPRLVRSGPTAIEETASAFKPPAKAVAAGRQAAFQPPTTLSFQLKPPPHKKSAAVLRSAPAVEPLAPPAPATNMVCKNTFLEMMDDRSLSPDARLTRSGPPASNGTAFIEGSGSDTRPRAPCLLKTRSLPQEPSRNWQSCVKNTFLHADRRSLSPDARLTKSDPVHGTSHSDAATFSVEPLPPVAASRKEHSPARAAAVPTVAKERKGSTVTMQECAEVIYTQKNTFLEFDDGSLSPPSRLTKSGPDWRTTTAVSSDESTTNSATPQMASAEVSTLGERSDWGIETAAAVHHGAPGLSQGSCSASPASSGPADRAIVCRNTFLDFVDNGDGDDSPPARLTKSTPGWCAPPGFAEYGDEERGDRETQLACRRDCTGNDKLEDSAGVEDGAPRRRRRRKKAVVVSADPVDMWKQVYFAAKATADSDRLEVRTFRRWARLCAKLAFRALGDIPLDRFGVVTSAGSVKHACGELCQPCLFHCKEKGCFDGIWCLFCHFPDGHTTQKSKQKEAWLAHGGKGRGKGKGKGRRGSRNT